ncbi:MAG: hypothetical protein R2852_00475 [Bacteroidia bacterium]
MPNIFDQTEKLIHEYAEIREHNAAFKTLYTELCSDDLLKHYKVFTGENKSNILAELNKIEEAIETIGKNMSSHRSEPS